MKHILFNSPKHIFLFPQSTQLERVTNRLSPSQRKELRKLYYTFNDQHSRANSILNEFCESKIHLDFVTLGVVLIVKLFKVCFFRSKIKKKIRSKREKQKLKAKKSCESNKNTRNHNNNFDGRFVQHSTSPNSTHITNVTAVLV